MLCIIFADSSAYGTWRQSRSSEVFAQLNPQARAFSNLAGCSLRIEGTVRAAESRKAILEFGAKSRLPSAHFEDPPSAVSQTHTLSISAITTSLAALRSPVDIACRALPLGQAVVLQR